MLTKYKRIFAALVIALHGTLLFAQTHNSVDLENSVYTLLEIAELKGIVSRLSQMRPYTKSRIISLLQEINSQRHTLTELEKSVLDKALERYAPADREVSALNIWKEGKIHINNEEDTLFPMAFGTKFDFEQRIDVASGTFSSVNSMEWFAEGDVSDFMSYDIRVGAGANNIDSEAYAPYSYSKEGDGYMIALSGGLDGGGLVDGDQDGSTFSFLFIPELSTSFLEERVQLNWARHRRDMGNGTGNLSLSATARPYDGIDFKLRPADWFSFYYSVGSLGDWFEGSLGQADDNNNRTFDDDELLYQNMMTNQLFEFMPFDWFYFSISNAVVWGKRLELSYMMPFILPMFAQNLTGDHDNAAIELSLSFKLPYNIELYGTAFADELRFNTSFLTDPAIQLGLQGGVRWIVPGLPFTIAGFQYTKIDPYAYTHYAQDYPFFDSAYFFDTSWTNDGENLGYNLPPNSDEFLFRFDSLPYKSLSILLQYQYIRHGEGNWEEGEIEGDTSAGGEADGTAHAYHATGDKDFLNDGIYEKIHIATIGASYEVDTEYIPMSFELDYSFVYGNNMDNIEGNKQIKNIFGFKIHLFPNN